MAEFWHHCSQCPSKRHEAPRENCVGITENPILRLQFKDSFDVWVSEVRAKNEAT